MNADEARKLTEDSLSEVEIEQFIEQIDKRIAVFAKHRRVINPFNNLKPRPCSNEVDAIKTYYIKGGFKIEDFPDPDPGHPCSSSYETMSW